MPRLAPDVTAPVRRRRQCELPARIACEDIFPRIVLVAGTVRDAPDREAYDTESAVEWPGPAEKKRLLPGVSGRKHKSRGEYPAPAGGGGCVGCSRIPLVRVTGRRLLRSFRPGSTRLALAGFLSSARRLDQRFIRQQRRLMAIRSTAVCTALAGHRRVVHRAASRVSSVTEFGDPGAGTCCRCTTDPIECVVTSLARYSR